MFRLTPAVKTILIINFALFLIEAFLKIPLADIFGMRVVFSSDFAIYQPFTYMWLHGGFGHIFGNMLAVFFFGPLLEQVLDTKRFMQYYLICGLGAGVLFGVADFVEKYPLKQDAEAYVENPNPDDFYTFILDHDVRNFGAYNWFEYMYNLQEQYAANPGNAELRQSTLNSVNRVYQELTSINMIGASGAVFGILLAFAMFFPNQPIYIYFLFPIKAKYLVLFYGLYELYAQFSRTPGDNIAHLAHLGGMLVGFIVLKYWQKDQRRFY
jgi:membrane associated rhomboid family serine protease